uniref:Uncharacterized protein n=1 Tax=Tanacetum cinerariifolium TaxID=118510 RepID=A0A6L2JBS5_TANCI|nr:hypothetical protein [Tanacetum cinerariifolium]
MDSIIPLGQKNTLVEYMILSGADNRLPMLEKDLYDSWKSRMELYMRNIEYRRMILESVENGPLIWPTVEENGVTKINKYTKLSVAKTIQADCDMKENDIIFQGDDPIACLNKLMAFLTAVASSRFPSTNNQLRTSSNPRSQATIQDGNNASGQLKVVKCYNCQDDEQLAFLADPGVPDGQAALAIISNIATFQIEDLDTYDSDCDDILNEKQFSWPIFPTMILTDIDLGRKYFKNNDLKAQQQDKDTTICKLKEIIKSMREKSKEEDNVNFDYCEIETKNVELENSVTRVRTNEHSDSLIDKLNLKSAKNEDLKAQIQDKVFVITSLKNDLRKVKEKEIVDIAAQKPSANTIVPGMYKLHLDPLALKLLQNNEAHIDYLKYTQEQADILEKIVE